MAIQIQLRRGTAAQWTSANTTLAQGELGIETDTNKIKIGDGTTAWTSLSYWVGGATTVGSNFLNLTNPSAITFPRINADNTVTAQTAANFKTDLSLNNVENTALSTWAGSTNITTLGTIGSGTWNASTIAANKGGTGQSTYAIGDILYADTTSTLAKLADVATGNALISGGTSTAPSWGKVGLTTHISGVLPIANGGTNANLTLSNGGIIYSTASAFAVLSGTATANQILLSGSSTTPSWSTATYPSTAGINTILYASAANVIGTITAANSSVLVTSATGVPSLSTTLPAVTLTSPVIDSIAGSAAGQAINLYTATTSTITIGSSTSTTTIAGTTFNAAVATSASIATGTSATTINIGTGTGTTTKTIAIGSGSTAGSTTINIGSTTAGVAAINLDGAVTVKAGTSTVAPFALTSGTNLTSGYSAGDFEFDTDKLYFTPNATTGRGMIQAVHMVALAGNSPTATTSTTAQNIFAAANDVLTLETAKMYTFRAKLYFTSTFTSGTAAVNFLPTFSNAPVNIKYRFITYPSTAGTALSRIGFVTATGATQVTPSITATITYLVEVEGIFETNATTGGTFTPQMSMTATGSSTVGIVNSTFEIVKVGANGAAIIAGLWA